MQTRILDFNDDLTEEQWQHYKRELADYGCFYDDEDELMRILRIRRAQVNREREEQEGSHKHIPPRVVPEPAGT